MLQKFTSLFPFWAIIFSALALLYPNFFVPYKDTIPFLLGLVMFGMGMTLVPKDFLIVLRKPEAVFIGTVLQYLLMPLIGYTIARLFSLQPDFIAGVVLLGCCPGGTASNVISYLAKGDVALSIVLTSVSTLISFIMTPLLTWLYIGQSIDVDVHGMVISILQIVIFPVATGIIINTVLSSRIEKIRHLFPLISVLTIVFIIAIIMALNREMVLSAGILLMSVVVLHNLLGLASGYGLAKLLGLSEIEARTIGIEVGMQNSGLSVALSIKYFTATAALPGALFSIWHNISGSFAASYWTKKNILK